VIRLLLLACILLAAGCDRRSFDQTRNAEPAYLDAADPAEQATATAALSEALLRGTRAWRLQPGDTLEFGYMLTGLPIVQDYRLGVGDHLEVVFQQQPQYSKLHVVRPDGRITLIRHGEIMAAGLRPLDLGRSIGARYRDELVDPQVSVHVMRASDEAERFAAMVAGSTGPRAQSFTIGPDGTITPPMMQSIKVAGLTVDEVAERAISAYRERLPGVTTTVRLSATTGQVVFVFGEVQRPGPQPAAPARSILQLVAASGGPNEFAAMDQVRLLFWDAAGQGRVRVANLNNVLENLALNEDMAVPPGSILFVPPTRLARAGRMMDQVFRRLFLYSGTAAGFYFSGTLPTALGGTR
jgi:polysaccharide export outer membrane protein